MTQLAFQLKPKVALRIVLLDYLKRHHYMWINGGKLEELAIEYGYKASTAGRILRDLAEKGKIRKRIPTKSVEYRYIWKELKN